MALMIGLTRWIISEGRNEEGVYDLAAYSETCPSDDENDSLGIASKE